MLNEHPVFPILLSKDLDATRMFYRDVLGLEIARDDEGDRIAWAAWFIDPSGNVLAVVQPKG
jgi:predicted enzyme related to lactoylglutathione lyase